MIFFFFFFISKLHPLSHNHGSCCFSHISQALLTFFSQSRSVAYLTHPQATSSLYYHTLRHPATRPAPSHPLNRRFHHFFTLRDHRHAETKGRFRLLKKRAPGFCEFTATGSWEIFSFAASVLCMPSRASTVPVSANV